MKKSILLITMLSVCLLLVSCQTGFEPYYYRGSDDGSDEYGYRADYDILDKGPVSGGSLNLFSTEPDSLNPILTRNTYTSEFLSFIYEGLTRLDSSQKALPCLSDKWSASDDGLIWNFHIREGVTWHDGEPFTAYDVEFTIQTILNLGIDSIYKPLLYNVITCAAIDSSNIRIALEKPNSFMPEMMTFPILPKHQFENADFLSVSEQFSPVGTGPYKYVSYTESKSINMLSNQDWWYLKIKDNTGLENAGTNTGGRQITDTDEAVKNQAGMYIEKINVNIFKNQDDAMGAFRTGDVDVTIINADDFSKYKTRTDLNIKKFTSRDYEFLAFNLKNPVFSDYFARKAIEMAIDKDALINKILLGEAEAADIPILPDSWISDVDGVQPYLPSLNTESSDGTNAQANATQKTQETLSEAESAVMPASPAEILELGGWKESKQGYYKRINGQRKYLKVELIVNLNNTTRVRVAKEICEQLKIAGIPSEVKEIEWNDLLNRLNTSKYDIAFLGCRIPQIPDLSFLYSGYYLPIPLTASSQAAYNVSGYSNLQVDMAINDMFRENSPDRKRQLYKGIKQQILEDCPYIGLYFLRDAMVYSKNIKGPQTPTTWNHYSDILHWYKPEIP
jgi:peptide/nickel transport system substrate-binding protein